MGTYQDFDGTGASRSAEKLKALRLDALPRKDRTKPPLNGLSVLDIGCNEGFFCIEAIRQGARHVVGIDIRPKFTKLARERCPQATIIDGSWWDVPDEQFDIILFLSAIHYEPEQKRLLAKLQQHLAPTGVLVLECGIVRAEGVRGWRTARRHDGIKRYPTQDHLIYDLLSDYAVRAIGPSAKQAGDPIPRFVYHCTRRANTALLVGAEAGSGKTVLARQFSGRGVPVFSIDPLLARLLRDPLYEHYALAQSLTKVFGEVRPTDFRKVGIFIAESTHLDEITEVIASECPIDAPLFVIEGDLLRHTEIMRLLKRKLQERGVTCWIVAA